MSSGGTEHTNKFQLECFTINHWTILARELLRTNYTGIIGLHLNVNCRYGVPKSNYRYQYNQYNQRQCNVYMWKLCTLSSIIKPPKFALAFWFYSLPPSLIHKSCYAQWTFSSNGSCNSLKRWIWLLKLNKSFNKKSDSRSRSCSASFRLRQYHLLSCFEQLLGCNSLQKTLNNRSKCWIGNLKSQWTFLLSQLPFTSDWGNPPEGQRRPSV